MSTAIPKKTPLFFPRHNPPQLRYTEDDRAKAYREQPLEFIPNYLIPERGRNLLPPVLNLGWIINTEVMLNYAREHDIDTEIVDGEVSFDTCIQALGSMVDHNGVPNDDRIQIVFLSDGDYDSNAHESGKLNLHISVRAGTNYKGHIAYEDVCLLGNLVAPGVKAQWFLDKDEWQWKRVKSQVPHPQKTPAPAPPQRLSAAA